MDSAHNITLENSIIPAGTSGFVTG